MWLHSRLNIYNCTLKFRSFVANILICFIAMPFFCMRVYVQSDCLQFCFLLQLFYAMYCLSIFEIKFNSIYFHRQWCWFRLKCAIKKITANTRFYSFFSGGFFSWNVNQCIYIKKVRRIFLSCWLRCYHMLDNFTSKFSFYGIKRFFSLAISRAQEFNSIYFNH